MPAPVPAPASSEPRAPALTKGERTALRVLDAAEARFAASGFAATTLRDVAADAGLREPSLYNHFPSKDALYTAVLDRAFQPMLDLLEVVLGAEDPTALPFPGESMARLFAGNPTIPRLLHHEVLNADSAEGLHPVLAEWSRTLFDRGARAIDASALSGKLTPQDTVLLILSFHNLVMGYFVAGPLLAQVGTDVADPAVLERQILLLRRIARGLLG